MYGYNVVYIGIGGIERCAFIEADDAYDARKEFEESYWSYYEILRIEEVKEHERGI